MAKTGTHSFDLSPSLLGQGVVTAGAALVVALLFYQQLSIGVFLVALIFVIAVWAWLMHRINRFRWRRLLISHQGDQVVLIGRDKYREAGRLGRRLIVSGFVTCFRVRGERRGYWLCLFSDNTDSESWKKLRALLSPR